MEDENEEKPKESTDDKASGEEPKPVIPELVLDPTRIHDIPAVFRDRKIPD